MPDTQAFSVDWTVTVAPEGDVSQDVAEIVLVNQDGVDTATVVLDTSERPHALEEQQDISIEVSDGNTTRSFDGFTDSVSDDDTEPKVTVDARTSSGLLYDATAVGVISENNLFEVIDAILDQTPGKVREITFDPTDLEAEYGTFAGATNYARIDVIHDDGLNTNQESFEKRETSDQGKECEIRFGSYQNNTANTYQMTINGVDSDGDTVSTTLDLPPGVGAEDAFGDDDLKLGLSGGNEVWTEVTGFTTDIPDFDTQGGTNSVVFSANIWNYVKTDWKFRADSLTSVRGAIASVVNYISGLDTAREWDFQVDNATDTLVVAPKAELDQGTSTWVFQEGDNVLKPTVSRNIDGVRNFIKVSGDGVNAWAWAYNGKFRWTYVDPFEETNVYPDNGGIVFDQSPAGGQNDIDQINLRAEVLNSNRISSVFQAVDFAKKALQEFYRTPVTGQAPVSGVHPAVVGDSAEVIYPSRGIPQKVGSNVYPIEKVEIRITPNEAKTTIDFGTPKPNVGDMITAGDSLVRNDISSNIARMAQSIENSSTSEDEEDDEGGSDFPIVGTLNFKDSQTGLWNVDGEDGNNYDDVQVI